MITIVEVYTHCYYWRQSGVYRETLYETDVYQRVTGGNDPAISKLKYELLPYWYVSYPDRKLLLQYYVLEYKFAVCELSGCGDISHTRFS